MAKKSSKADTYELITERVLAAIDRGVAPWRTPWGGAGGPANYATGKAYRGINPFVLLCSPFESPYWLTFKQALDQGGHVRKGEKGTPVTFWKLWKKKNAAGEEDSFPVLRRYTVFNVEQCEALDPKPVETFDNDPIAAAERIAGGWDAPAVEAGPAPRYCPADDVVHIPTLGRFKTAEEYYASLFHEFGHATGHAKRLNRPGVADAAGLADRQKYGQEELVAEFAAAFLCGAAGISPAVVDNQAAYLEGWRKVIKADPKILVTAAGKAQKAADLVLGTTFED